MTDAREGTPVRSRCDEADVVAAAVEARERQAWVRHELRAPLAVIYPLLSMLQDGATELSRQQQEFLEVLSRNVTRLEALVTAAVDSGWADCSQSPVLAGDVALRDVVEQVVTLRLADDPEGPYIVPAAGPAPAPHAWADADDVRQILADLVGNACTYGRDPVRIAVADGAERGTVVVEVTDAGPGMPPEELDRAFEFGFRGELARDLKAPGLGAGLWVCRELARRNGGSLSLASELGAGFTATLTLPSVEGRP